MNELIPASYEFINSYNGTRSPTGEVTFDYTTKYFFRSLYDRMISLFEFTIPEEWNKKYFINVLYNLGYIGIIKTPKYGVIPQICTFSGYGLYLQPTRILVSQPLVQFEGRRGENCELLQLTQDYTGVLDIVEHYATQLSTCYTSITASLFNSRIAFISYAKSKQAAETLKMMLEKIYSGDPAVIVDKIVTENWETNEEPIFAEAFHAKDSYITDKLLENMSTIISSFDREIGIPQIADKKERRIESELEYLTSDSGARCKVWERCLNDSIEEIKRVFPDLKLSFKYAERGESNVLDSKADDDRAV